MGRVYVNRFSSVWETLQVRWIMWSLSAKVDKGSGKNNRRRRVSEETGREKSESSRQEDRENKGPTTGKLTNYTPRSVLEETNNASGSAAKLRKRNTGLKSVETNQRRPVRNRKARTGVREENSDDDDHIDNIKLKNGHLVRSEEENISEEDEVDEEQEDEIEAESEPDDLEKNEQRSETLIKRLKNTRKLRSGKISEELIVNESVQEEKNNHQENKNKDTVISGLKSQAKAEEDESESRERDREPEPPPLLSLETNNIPEKQINLKINKSPSELISLKDNQQVEITVGIPSINVEAIKTKTIIEEKNSTVDKSTRATSGESVEFVESSSQDGSVLERLSPVSGGGPGRQSLLHDEQERNRHNESPVILAERINKPPPLHHQQQQQQQQQQHSHHQYQHIHPSRYTTSPIIRLESSSPHQNRHHSTLIEVSDKSHNQSLQSQHGDEAGGHLMEVETGGGGLPGVVGVVASGVRGAAYGDSGSDSGISSLRSAGSGDERSGSRSSAISAEDTSTTTIATTTPVTNIQQTSATIQSQHQLPQQQQQQSAAPARIWHVHSVQHQSLMMAHQQATGQTMPANNTQVGYQNSTAGHHHHHHHHPTVSTDMLWRAPRYPPLALLAPGQPTPDEMLERDRHERMIREHREAEVRELEKREREREAKMEREKLEKQRAAEQAVHKHFEESLRLAQQKTEDERRKEAKPRVPKRPRGRPVSTLPGSQSPVSQHLEKGAK
ncbi:hypothetical protein PV327_001431 [Microctonus hyperodae]|uniref:Uncharacterized protein n=1 Tax=Microctonus hyperodae TaxID=165561 RepID=A0AA39L2Z0_MICHY|nr:hypothetical protein PV327_001431 [Microctonus hyperodae]